MRRAIGADEIRLAHGRFAEAGHRSRDSRAASAGRSPPALRRCDRILVASVASRVGQRQEIVEIDGSRASTRRDVRRRAPARSVATSARKRSRCALSKGCGRADRHADAVQRNGMVAANRSRARDAAGRPRPCSSRRGPRRSREARGSARMACRCWGLKLVPASPATGYAGKRGARRFQLEVRSQSLVVIAGLRFPALRVVRT